MTLHNQFENQWNSLASTGTLQVSTDDGEVQCTLSEVSPLAANLDKLNYYSERIGGASVEQLESLGRGLCERVTYLMEPLALVEIDGEAQSVQARSTPPQHDESSVRYFELSVSAQRGLSLQRFEAPRRSPRTAIPAAMTRETLERLVGDCVEAVEESL